MGWLLGKSAHGFVHCTKLRSIFHSCGDAIMILFGVMR